MLLVSLELDEMDCRMLERADPQAKHVLRSSISLPDARRRIHVDRSTAQAWRDWFRRTGLGRSADAIEARLPSPGLRR